MLCFLFAALIVALDQFFKHWVLRTLSIGEAGPELIPGVIGLTRWENDGAMLNILSGQQWLLAGIAFVAAVVLVMILLRYNEGFWGTLALSAVLGGTVGNLIDRILNEGRVVDMFRTLFISFPIFNIADIFITLGFITFLVHFIVLTVKSGKQGKLSATDGEAFSYEQPEEAEAIDSEGFDDLESIIAVKSEQEVSSADSSFTPVRTAPVAPVAQVSEAYSPIINDIDVSTDTTPDVSFSLESMESELESLEEYNLEDILREYGIEDDDYNV